MTKTDMEEKFFLRLNKLFDSDPRTDTAISDALGVSKQTVSYWRQGLRSPKRSMVVKIADMYNVSVAWLMGLDSDGADNAKTYNSMTLSVIDQNVLEAMHQNPRLGLLFDRQRKMPPEAVENMLNLTNMIVKEFDGDESE